MKIPASELILNPDGSIYHLGLQPEEIADTVLTVGDPGRVANISKHFEAIEVKRERREFHTHTGYYNGKRMTVISTGIGPDNIDIVLNELDALVNIDLRSRERKDTFKSLEIIRVGTCGGLQPDVPVDQFVLSSFAIGLDNLLHFYHHTPTLPAATLYDELHTFQEDTVRLPIRPYCVAGSDSLRDRLSAGIPTGITLTCPGFYAPQGRSLRLPSRFTPALLQTLQHFSFRGEKIVNLEMETSAIYGMSHLLGHRAASCSVILANRSIGQFSQDPKAAIEKLILKVLDLITK